MSLNSCLFAVRLPDPRERPNLDRRVEALRAFYEPLGPARVTARYVEALQLLLGQITFDGSEPAEGPLVWGGPLPAGLADERALVDATDAELRAADGVVVAAGAVGPSARLISGAGGITALHRSSAAGFEAFATHAVAAAWLARGEVSIASETIAELVAHDFVGADRHLVERVSTLDPAARIDFSPTGPSAASYWPAAERWGPVDEGRAYDHARAALLEALDRRLPTSGVELGLTGGLDSRVVALALTHLRPAAHTFTWGEPEWEDVVMAARTARELGLTHSSQPVDYREDEAAIEAIDAEVRWTEGITPVRFAAQTFPDGLRAVLYGSGGEIGRAFYYGRELVRAFPKPGERDLRLVFSARRRIHGAHRKALDALASSERRWLADAAALGARGWNVLDVVYAEQRVRKWGRSMLPRVDGVMVPAFAQPEIARGLISMALADRVTDGFHRRFLAETPALAVPAPAPSPPQSAPRRAVSRIPRARRALIAWRHRRAPESGGIWTLAERWASRPQLRSWIADEALGSDLISQSLGARWARETRAGFMKDQSVPTQNALLAAAPYSLERALRKLNGSQPG